MSHGPSIRVYELTEKYFDVKKREEIVSLLKSVDVGTEEEREYVSKYINNMLFEPKTDTKGFAFWNHRPDQEVEDYDVLCDLFETYGKIISSVCLCTVIVQSDYRDYKILSEDGQFYKISDESMTDLDDWMNKLRLKSKINEGERAKEELSKINDALEKKGDGGSQ